MNLQRVGGFASVVNTFLGLVFLIILVVVFPHLGFVGSSDWNDPVKGIAAWTSSYGPFFSFNIDYILMSIASLLTILALQDRMQAGAPTLMRIAVIVTAIACALWVAAGFVPISGKPLIISSNDTSAYRAVMCVFLGLSNAGDHVFGWACLVTGWAALRTRKLSRILIFFLMLEGFVFIFDFCSMPIALVAVVFYIIISLWLGVVLLRSNEHPTNA